MSCNFHGTDTERTRNEHGNRPWTALALACPACFGASDAPMAEAMNWGVLTLLAITVLVLGAFAGFFVRLARRAREVAQ